LRFVFKLGLQTNAIVKSKLRFKNKRTKNKTTT